MKKMVESRKQSKSLLLFQAFNLDRNAVDGGCRNSLVSTRIGSKLIGPTE